MRIAGASRRIRSLLEAWGDASSPPRPRLPVAIQFPINDVCNSRCQMCNIWTLPKKGELDADQVRRILSSELFAKVTSIGFNGGEPTIKKDFREIVEASIDSLPNLRGVSLITNAILESRTRTCVDQLADLCNARGINLDVMVSIDGVGAVHDRVRGTPGNFESASRFVDHLLSRPERWTCRIGCTVIRENVYDVENVLEWAIHKGVYARFRLGIPHQRLRSDHLEAPFALSDPEKYHFCSFLDGLRADYESDPARNAFYLSLRDQVAYEAPRKAGCLWRNRGATLLPDGGIAYCALKSPRLGSGLEVDPSALYWGGLGSLERIQQEDCRDCRHDYDGIGDRISLARSIFHRRFGPQSAVRRTLAGAKVFRATVSGLIPTLRVSTRDPKRERHILIVGWYGTETAGDKAILGALVRTARSRDPGVRITVASLEPYVTLETRRQMPELDGIDVIGLEQARRNCQDALYSDFVFGGGPLMSSIGALPELVKIAGISKRSGARIILAGCGIGPLGNAAGDRAIRNLVRLADEIVARDEDSARLARSFHPLGGVRVAQDPAMLWVRTSRSPDIHRERKLALALRDWPIHEYAARIPDAETIKSRFESELVEFVRTLLDDAPDLVIQPVCMHRLPVGGDDRKFYRRVFSDFEEILDRIPTRHQTPLEVLREFETSSGALAMRFHSAVFGLGLGLPMTVLDYTAGGKIAALLRDNRQPAPIGLSAFRGAVAAKDLLARMEDAAPSPPDTEESRNVYESLF